MKKTINVVGIDCPICTAAISQVVHCPCSECKKHNATFSVSCPCGLLYIGVGISSLQDFLFKLSNRPLQINRLQPSTN